VFEIKLDYGVIQLDFKPYRMIHWLFESAQNLVEPPEWFLSAAEMERYSLFQFPKRRADWLLGRWTAKRLLQAVLLEQFQQLVPLDSIEITNDGDGVPHATCYLLPAAYHLSLSHSRQHALAAVSPQVVGADLEFVEPRAENFFDDYFTDREIASVKQAALEVRDTLVTAIWSAKEAALKALHKGLSVDTRAVDITFGPVQQAPEQWSPFQATVSGLLPETSLRGWWRVLGGYVLTLAASLGEIPDAIELQPETFLVAHVPLPREHAPHRIGQLPHHPSRTL
jgi:4'-phosphopantetheinyl transferase